MNVNDVSKIYGKYVKLLIWLGDAERAEKNGEIFTELKNVFQILIFEKKNRETFFFSAPKRRLLKIRKLFN